MLLLKIKMKLILLVLNASNCIFDMYFAKKKKRKEKILIVIKQLEMDCILVLNSPWGVDMFLNK